MRVYTNLVDPEKKKKKTGIKASVKKIKSDVPEYSLDVRDPGSVTKDYSGQAAPRTGGEAQKSTGMASGTASKKVIRLSKKRARQSAGSKAAKKSAIKALKGRY